MTGAAGGGHAPGGGGRGPGGGVDEARELSVRDPGAQPERTRLAWRRTTLTFAVCVGLAVRAMLDRAAPVAAVAAALGLLAWLGFLAVAHRRIAGMAAARPKRMDPATARFAALGTLVMTMVGVVLLWR